MNSDKNIDKLKKIKFSKRMKIKVIKKKISSLCELFEKFPKSMTCESNIKSKKEIKINQQVNYITGIT